MDGPALSGWERRLLEEIESDLRQDTRLDRKLSTMGAKPPGPARRALRAVGRRLTAGVVLTALVTTAICLSIGVRTPTTAVLTALGVVWAASVAAAVVASELLRRRRGGRRAEATDPRDWPEPGEHRERRERRPWDRPEA
ncbi:DUF3040 domain-containing protein [Kitasatospora sp. NPDC101183]|uniref:DUF3040 domain-containing protein n=1 Tax=Kitasatospora sp. NPDC101183 TaxID=3364100 RepID=UPI0038087F06